jgi:hypothetical protein
MMVLGRRTTAQLHGYTVAEVARFLQFDADAIRYWLRTGHLTGQFDPTIADWRVEPCDLVAFLRQSSEPMPTGIVTQHHASVVLTEEPLSAVQSPASPVLERDPLLVGQGIGV